MKKIGRSRRIRFLFYLGFGVIALIILAAGLSSLELQTGEILMQPFERPQVLLQEREEEGEPGFIDLSTVGNVLALAAVVIVCLYAAVRWRQVRYTLITLLFFVGSLLALIYLYSQVVEPPAPPQQEETPPQIEERRLSPDLLNNPPDWLDPLSIVITAGILAVAAVVTRFLWRRLRPRPAGTLELLAGEAEAALAEIRSGVDLKDAVMRCYVEMNQTLRKGMGLVRDEGMTPREFEQQLAGAGLPGQSVRRLTRLFESVRYGGQASSEGERQEAIACLEAIVYAAQDQLEGPVNEQLQAKTI